ncbi:hypothetical protein TNCV_1109921 [Trichonephila clavipes]|nr:hypothetical protein TNCV_1109921 [Trichonephila clavipes]
MVRYLYHSATAATFADVVGNSIDNTQPNLPISKSQLPDSSKWQLERWMKMGLSQVEGATSHKVTFSVVHQLQDQTEDSVARKHTFQIDHE